MSSGSSLTPARWARVEALFHDAVKRVPSERAAFLRDHCAGDDELREQVNALLDAHDTGDVLADPVRKAVEDLGRDVTMAAGTRVGPYAIVSHLGDGGAGTVYLGERADAAFDKRVAIKVIQAGKLNEDALERFLSERQILARLEHPNVASLLDGGTTDDGWPYLVMEYIDGQPINDYCNSKQLDVPARITLFRQVCAAVQYAHRNLVVHRDLKPSNILVTEQGIPKLLDFGIAKMLSPEDLGRSAFETQAGMRVMTPQHASPEQVRGEIVTTASDVYSLGVLLYQLLTGKLPYQVESTEPLALERAICETMPERPSTVATTSESAVGDVGEMRLRRALRGDLDNIVMMALRKEPERRYGTPAALAEDLQAFLERRPVTARADSWGYRTGKFLSRNRYSVGAATVATAIIVGLFAYYTVQLSREIRTANQVTEFLVGIFEIADPNSGRGSSVTAGELLDTGAEQLRTDLVDQPVIRGRLMDTIGRAYYGLGLYPAAAEVLDEALTVRETVLSAGHPDTTETRAKLGTAYLRIRDYDKARPLLEQALAEYEQQNGRSHPIVARALTQISNLHYRTGDYDDMKDAAERALAILVAHDLGDHADAIEPNTDLGNYYWRTGDYDSASDYHERALDLVLKHIGPDNRRVANSTYNLGLLDWQRGRYEQARDRYVNAIAMWEKSLGPEHPHVAHGLYSLAITQKDLAEYAAARENFKRSLAIREKRFGADNEDVAFTLTGYGFLLIEMDELDEARAAYERALAIYDGSEVGQVDIATALAGLGHVAMKQAQYDEAARHFGRALTLREQALGPEHEDVGRIRVSLGKLALARGQPDIAIAEHQRALTLYGNALEPDHPYIGDAHCQLARALQAAGRPEPARMHAEQALAILSAKHGADHPTTQACVQSLAPSGD